MTIRGCQLLGCQNSITISVQFSNSAYFEQSHSDRRDLAILFYRTTGNDPAVAIFGFSSWCRVARVIQFGLPDISA